MKILISIPLFLRQDLHWEFTEQTIASIQTKEHQYELFLVNNFSTPELKEKVQSSGFVLHENPAGNALSAAWNMGIHYAKENGFDYVLTSNNDLLFHPEALDNLVRFAQEHSDFVMWTMAETKDLRGFKTKEYDHNFDEHPHFSCFMVANNFPDILGAKESGTKEPYPGYFDENYRPAYFEDGDMHNRILRAGLVAVKTGSALFYHYGSRTIKVDEELDHENGVTYEKNREYFSRKWGFDPHGQVISNDDPVRFKYKGAFEP